MRYDDVKSSLWEYVKEYIHVTLRCGYSLSTKLAYQKDLSNKKDFPDSKNKIKKLTKVIACVFEWIFPQTSWTGCFKMNT